MNLKERHIEKGDKKTEHGSIKQIENSDTDGDAYINNYYYN